METPVAKYDLHLHTYWSYDATATPDAYLSAASDAGMDCIAITEHHTIDSQPELESLREKYPDVRVIPAAELSVHTAIGAVDILCYGLPTSPDAAFQSVLDTYHQWQQDYGAAFCAGMQTLGFDYTNKHRRELLGRYRPDCVFSVQGVTHVQNEAQRDYFIERGFIADAKGYASVINQMRRLDLLPAYPEAGTVCPVVRQTGALISIAHPFGYFNQYDDARMHALVDECLLDGIECAHPKVPVEFTKKYRAWCETNGLFSTAGTDCHHQWAIDAQLGRHGGQNEWLDEFLDRLDRK